MMASELNVSAPAFCIAWHCEAESMAVGLYMAFHICNIPVPMVLQSSSSTNMYMACLLSNIPVGMSVRISCRIFYQ
jgi:hypothetical protein